jgi:hypothetical protein
MGEKDFAWLDGLRQRHFPTDRNYLRAHLTMFHHLPPSVEAEVAALLKQLTRRPAPVARLSSLVNLGRGVAYRIDSPELEDVRDYLARHFAPLLTPQDSARWRPHVTIQNKVKPEAARSLLHQLDAGFAPAILDIAGLALWRYRNGPWEAVGAWRFGQGHAMAPPLPLSS